MCAKHARPRSTRGTAPAVAPTPAAPPARRPPAAGTASGSARISREALDALALQAAIAQACKSAAEGGIPIGAALMAPDGTILAVGHNLRVQTGDPTAHGETVCIRNAGRRPDWHTLTLATTLSPCAMCSGTAILHRIPRLIIGECRTFQGREDWLADAGVEIRHFDDDRCIKLMNDFIRRRPEVWNEDIGVPPDGGGG